MVGALVRSTRACVCMCVYVDKKTRGKLSIGVGGTTRTTYSGRSKNGLELRLALSRGVSRIRGYSLPFGSLFRAMVFPATQDVSDSNALRERITLRRRRPLGASYEGDSASQMGTVRT